MLLLFTNNSNEHLDTEVYSNLTAQTSELKNRLKCESNELSKSVTNEHFNNRNSPNNKNLSLELMIVCLGSFKDVFNVTNNRIDPFYEYFISKYYDSEYDILYHKDMYFLYNTNFTIFNIVRQFWLNNMLNYEDMDFRNVFIGRKITMILTGNLISRTYCKNIYIEHESIKIVLNCIVKFNEHQIRINWFYLAKYLSKPKFDLLNNVSSTSKPKTSLLIIILLFMCGDTGASVNPGPITECNYCDKIIRYNSKFLTCQQCNLKVHLKCNNLSQSSNFICNLCTYDFLPDPLYGDNIPLDNDINTLDNNINTSDRNKKAIYENNDMYIKFKRKGLHFIHANVRSLFHKMSEIRHISRVTNAAVIAITETWLDDSYTDDSVSIDGYSIRRRDREGHAGGVCIYIRNDIAFNLRIDLHNDDLEDLWVEILLTNSKPIYVGVCYRNDKNNKLLRCLENTLSKLRQDCDLLVLGDFNICLLSNKSKLCKDYKSFLSIFNCKQLVNSPTRVTDKTSTLLDHIFTNNSDKFCQSGVLPVGLSDHYITYCTRKIIRGYVGTHNTIKIRSLKNYSTVDFLTKLRNTDWTIVTNCTDVNTAWSKFKDIFIKILDEIAPSKQVRIKTRTEPLDE